MTPLQGKMRHWRGARHLRETIESKGYGVHSVYRNFIEKNYSIEENGASIDLYFDEMANEFVSSCGVYIDRGSHKNEPGFYKSRFLESLESIAHSKSGTEKFHSVIHPSLRAFRTAIESPRCSARADLEDEIGARKMLEALEFRLEPSPLGEPQKANAYQTEELMWNMAMDLGFSRSPVSWPKSRGADEVFYFSPSQELIFYGYFDRQRTVRATIPIGFFVGIGEPDYENDFYLSDFRYLVPGMEFYSKFATRDWEVKLGLRALMGSLKDFAESFDF